MGEWISVKDELPICNHELAEDPNEDGNPQFDGFVSQSIEISDGYNLARGHYRDDGTWNIYQAEHDFQIVDPEKITHWAPMIKPPYLTS